MTKSGGGEELHLKKARTLADERNFAPVVWFTTRKMEGYYLLHGKWKVLLPSQFSKKIFSPFPGTISIRGQGGGKGGDTHRLTFPLVQCVRAKRGKIPWI